MITPTWINSITDTGIKLDLINLLAGGTTFTYGDALTLLQDVAARGSVTATEFADLETIADHLETQDNITSSTYVASLFFQLAEGSQANETYTAGATGSTTLGNLAAGTSSAQLGELISKWFLGTDLPNPTATGDGTSSGPTLHPTYSDFSGYKLFGTSGTPQVSDVAQGYDGDCELCSGMIDVLDNHPGMISSMFVSDGNGTYGVRFYVDGKETWVTVNSELPTYQGQLLYNDPLLSGGNDGLWASLIEKAYAQLSSDGLIDHPAVNSYDNISADAAFDVLTNLVNTNTVTAVYSGSSNWNAYKNIIIEAIQAGNDVVLETGTKSSDETFNSQGQQLLVADHAFAVIGYDSSTGDFIVRNPWGDEPNDSSYVTQFEVSMSDVASVDGDFAIDNSANPDVVFNYAQQIVGLASTTNSTFNLAATYLGTNTTVKLASLIGPMDIAGHDILYYRLELLGGDSQINLNGATNQANAAENAAGEMVVSATDLAKLTLTTWGTSGGNVDLFIAGLDDGGSGIAWSTPTELYWKIDANQLTVIPTVDAIVARGASMSVGSLFQIAGPLAGESGLEYFVAIESGGGTINLNGATDLLGGGAGGQIEVTAADLAKLTYTNSGTPGIAVIDITATDGTHNSDLTQVAVDVGYSVAATLNAFNQGATPYQVAVSDTAANIFADLDELQQMMPNWALLGLSTTDAGVVTETVSYDTLFADRGVLSILHSSLVLDVTGSQTAASVEGLPNLATVLIIDGNASQYTVEKTAEPGYFFLSQSDGTIGPTISNVVALQFSDHELIVASQTPLNGASVSSAQITELYSAVFGREPDVSGLNFYEQYATANPGTGFVSYAQFFLQSSEYTSNTAHNYAQTTAGDQQFITDLYNNLLHRAPDSGAVQYYLDNVITPALKGLTAGTAAYSAAEAAAHAQVLVYVSQSAEFLGDVQVTAAHPADATHWLVLV